MLWLYSRLGYNTNSYRVGFWGLDHTKWLLFISTSHTLRIHYSDQFYLLNGSMCQITKQCQHLSSWWSDLTDSIGNVSGISKHRFRVPLKGFYHTYYNETMCGFLIIIQCFALSLIQVLKKLFLRFILSLQNRSYPEEDSTMTDSWFILQPQILSCHPKIL